MMLRTSLERSRRLPRSPAVIAASTDVDLAVAAAARRLLAAAVTTLGCLCMLIAGCGGKGSDSPAHSRSAAEPELRSTGDAPSAQHESAGDEHGDQHGEAHGEEHGDDDQRVQLTPRAIELSGIATGLVEPHIIDVTVQSPGEVRLNGERVLQVRPRFPGVVKQLERRLGDTVRTGDLLAVIHSNESFTDYPIAASMAGTVVSREVAVGAAVDHEVVLYTVADLSSVWVDFAIYPQYVGQIRRGQSVMVSAAANGGLQASGRVDYVGPLLEQDTRMSYARVVLPNPNGDWLPGLFVSAAVTVERVQVAAAVPEEAIVRTAGGPAVFRAVDGAFVLQPVAIGRTDGLFTEVTQGVRAGDAIVVRNAFLVKAELGKSAAGHDH